MIYFCGFRTGMVKLPEDKIISKGSWPGQIIAIDLKLGKLYNDKEIKTISPMIIKNIQANSWFRQKTYLRKRESRIHERRIKERTYLTGLSIEDLELILHPMAEDGKEAIGSMGDDTPAAVYLIIIGLFLIILDKILAK